MLAENQSWLSIKDHGLNMTSMGYTLEGYLIDLRCYCRDFYLSPSTICFLHSYFLPINIHHAEVVDHQTVN